MSLARRAILSICSLFMAQVAHAQTVLVPEDRVFELLVGEKSFGTGFLVKYDDATYMLTAAHVAAGVHQRVRLMQEAGKAQSEYEFVMRTRAAGGIELAGTSYRIAADGEREVAWIELPAKIVADLSHLAFALRATEVVPQTRLKVYGHPWAGKATYAAYEAEARAKPTVGRSDRAGYQHYWTSCASSGFSGGPVIDPDGSVVGLHLGARTSKDNMWFFLLGSSFAEPPDADQFFSIQDHPAIHFGDFYAAVGLGSVIVQADNDILEAEKLPVISDNAPVGLVDVVRFSDMQMWTGGQSVQSFLWSLSCAHFRLPRSAEALKFAIDLELSDGLSHTLTVNGEQLGADARCSLSGGRNVVEVSLRRTNAAPYDVRSFIAQQSAAISLRSPSGLRVVAIREIPEAIERWSYQLVIDVPSGAPQQASLFWDPQSLALNRRDVALTVPLRSDDPATGAHLRGALTLFPIDNSSILVERGFLALDLRGVLSIQEASIPVLGGSIQLKPLKEELQVRCALFRSNDRAGERIHMRLVGIELAGAKVEIPLGQLGNQALTFDATQTLTALLLVWLNNVWVTQIDVRVPEGATQWLQGLTGNQKNANGLSFTGNPPQQTLENFGLLRKPTCLGLLDEDGRHCVRITPETLERFARSVEHAAPQDFHELMRSLQDAPRLRSLVHWTHLR